MGLIKMSRGGSGDRSGFSYVEVLFAAVLLFIVAFALYRVAAGGVGLHKKSVAEAGLEERIEKVLKKIESDIGEIHEDSVKSPKPSTDAAGKLSGELSFGDSNRQVAYVLRKTGTIKNNGINYNIGCLERSAVEKGGEIRSIQVENVVISKDVGTGEEMLSGFLLDDRTPSSGREKYSGLEVRLILIGSGKSGNEPETSRKVLRIAVKSSPGSTGLSGAEKGKVDKSEAFTMKMGEPTSLLAP